VMHEIAATFSAAGVTPDVHRAAAWLYHVLARTPLAHKTPLTAPSDRSPDQPLAAFLATLEPSAPRAAAAPRTSLAAAAPHRIPLPAPRSDSKHASEFETDAPAGARRTSDGDRDCPGCRPSVQRDRRDAQGREDAGSNAARNGR